MGRRTDGTGQDRASSANGDSDGGPLRDWLAETLAALLCTMCMSNELHESGSSAPHPSPASEGLVRYTQYTTRQGCLNAPPASQMYQVC